MSDHPKIRTATESQLRSWESVHGISSARFADEMERRRNASRVEIAEAPPLDYATSLGLARELDLRAFEQEIDDLIVVDMAEAIADAEKLPAAARPMWDAIEWFVLAAATLAGALLIGLAGWVLNAQGQGTP